MMGLDNVRKWLGHLNRKRHMTSAIRLAPKRYRLDTGA